MERHDAGRDYPGGYWPSGSFALAADAAGNVYIADAGNNAIEEWHAATQSLTTFSLPASGLSHPTGIAIDAAGNVYVADTGHKAVKEWKPATKTLATLFSITLAIPSGLAVDAAGDVYVADTGHNAIQEWKPGRRPRARWSPRR